MSVKPATQATKIDSAAISSVQPKYVRVEGVSGPQRKKQKVDASFEMPDYLLPSVRSHSTVVINASLLLNSKNSSTEQKNEVEPYKPHDNLIKEALGKSGKLEENSIFESDVHAVKKLCAEIIRTNDSGDNVFKVMFQKKREALRHRPEFKEATLEQKSYLVKAIAHDVKLEMAADDFVVPKKLLALASKTVDFKDDNIKFVVRAVKRDVRSIYSEQLKEFDPQVVRTAQRNRCIGVEESGWSLFVPRSWIRSTSQPCKPDLSFLKERKSTV